MLRKAKQKLVEVKLRTKRWAKEHSLVLGYAAFCVVWIAACRFVSKEWNYYIYSNGYGYSREETDFVMKKLNSLEPERARKLGRKLGKVTLWLLQREP